MPLFHPACLVSTFFGVGLIPIASGTWGSLAALPFAWAIQTYYGPWTLLVAAAIVLVLGIISSEAFVRRSLDKDPGPVVIDEVAGQWLVLVIAPTEFWYYLAGFLLFRLFDIRKPWPAGWIDKNVRGGMGIMLDDIVAGIFGFVGLWVIIVVTGGRFVFA
jgi:phosphatidylglycerophosphatase A